MIRILSQNGSNFSATEIEFAAVVESISFSDNPNVRPAYGRIKRLPGFRSEKNGSYDYIGRGK